MSYSEALGGNKGADWWGFFGKKREEANNLIYEEKNIFNQHKIK